MEKAKAGIAAILANLFRPWLIIYNLSFAYIGMLLATGVSLRVFALITIAFMAARLAALLMNRYAGRELDLKNRKKLANDASLAVPRGALLVGFVALAALFVYTAYLLNTLAALLSPLVLALFIIDPMLKRRTASRHFSVGLMESFSPLAGYIGVKGAFPSAPAIYMLVAGMVLLGAGFDIIYSAMHTAFDRRHGLKTYPAEYGVDRAMGISAMLHAAAALMLIAFALYAGGWIVFAGSLAAAAVLALEHMGIRGANDRMLMKRFELYNPLIAVLLLACVLAAALV